MTNTRVFRPRAELDANERLREFIRFGREELTTFGDELDFNDNGWDITGHIVIKGSNCWKATVWFNQFETGRGNKGIAMREPFLSFAKAYLRYWYTLHRDTGISKLKPALASLEWALAESGKDPNPVDASPDVFNRAAQLIFNRYSRIAAYTLGLQLEKISRFLVEHRLVIVGMPWSSFIRPLPNLSIKTGRQYEIRREKRLPSATALKALTHVYRNATHPQDILPTSVLALLSCAPSRISEVLSLPERCEHVTRDPGSGEEILRLRWWPAKGAKPMLKDVIPNMASVAREALSKIRTVTEPARAVARWYETHPSQIFLPLEQEHLRDRVYVNSDEVSAILGLRKAGGRSFCITHRIPVKSTPRRLIQFAHLEQAVLRELPRGFSTIPGTQLKYSDALFVVRRNELDQNKQTMHCLFSLVSTGGIHHQISSTGITTIFSRHGLTKSDGTRISITSHQLRHYLNTLAQSGGLSQIDIALWSGRKDIRPNEAYDHVSVNETHDMIRGAVGDRSKMIGPLADLPEPLPITRQEYIELVVPAVQLTDAGACIHDWSMSPCPYHTHCIDCEEHVYVKTSETREVNSIRRRDMKALYDKAQKATANGHAGANRWADKQLATLKRLEELLDMLEDPDVPDGTLITLPPRKV